MRGIKDVIHRTTPQTAVHATSDICIASIKRIELDEAMGILASAKILVTGADGFIGSHLVEALVRSGCDVRAMVLYNSFNSWGHLDNVPPEIKSSVEVVAGDVRDPHSVNLVVSGCQIVFHLAALIAIPYSYHSPASYVDTNVLGTLNMLQAAKSHNVTRFVLASTSEVYGTAQYAPIDEVHPIQCQSPYAATKTGADQLALSFYRSFEIPVAILRPFNTYGPRQSARAVIPTIITQILAGETSVMLGNTHPTRDFSFVADTARGFMSIAECDAALGEVVNIGSGYEISIGDTAQTIADLMAVDIKVKLKSDRERPKASEVERLIASVEKAQRLFQWQSNYTGPEGFRKGLSETIAWFSEPENLKRYKHDLYNI